MSRILRAAIAVTGLALVFAVGCGEAGTAHVESGAYTRANYEFATDGLNCSVLVLDADDLSGTLTLAEGESITLALEAMPEEEWPDRLAKDPVRYETFEVTSPDPLTIGDFTFPKNELQAHPKGVTLGNLYFQSATPEDC